MQVRELRFHPLFRREGNRINFPIPLARQRQAGRESEPAANHLRIALPSEARTGPSSPPRHVTFSCGRRDQRMERGGINLRCGRQKGKE